MTILQNNKTCGDVSSNIPAKHCIYVINEIYFESVSPVKHFPLHDFID